MTEHSPFIIKELIAEMERGRVAPEMLPRYRNSILADALRLLLAEAESERAAVGDGTPSGLCV